MKVLEKGELRPLNNQIITPDLYLKSVLSVLAAQSAYKEGLKYGFGRLSDTVFESTLTLHIH